MTETTMTMSPPKLNPLIDVADEQVPDHPLAINWVGMNGIKMPMTYMGQSIPARVGVWINLKDPSRKGIHMSRLYRTLNEALSNQNVDLSSLKGLLSTLLDTHSDCSDRVKLKINFEMALFQSSLLSQNKASRLYPAQITLTQCPNKTQVIEQVQVAYSSTCPCSAALSRQLIQGQFKADFKGETQISMDRVHEWLGQQESIQGTPHAQRSIASIQILTHDQDSQLANLVQLAEKSLKTPVQAVVKREDEQAFAQLNSQNLMFVEDAVRELCHGLSSQYPDIKVEVSHQESLHPHDAVASHATGYFELGL